MGMNKSERKVFNWLKKKYLKSEIEYMGRENPDFITNDGKGWEAKRLYVMKNERGKILFSNKQWREFLDFDEPLKIIVTKDESDKPIEVFSFNKIEDKDFGGEYKRMIIERWESRGDIHKTEKIVIRCTSKLKANFYMAKYENGYKDNAEFLKDLLTTERKFVVAEEESN